MSNRSPRRSRIRVAVLLAGACTAARAQPDPMEQHGGHPLATRRPGLADLLDQPDWANPPARPRAADEGFAPEPVAQPEPTPPDQGQPPRPQPVAAPDVTRAVQQAIDDRNRIVNRIQFFDTIDRIRQHEPELARRQEVLDGALKRQKEAAHQVDVLSVPGANLVAPGELARARQGWENTRAATQAAYARCQETMQVLQPLYDRLSPEIGPWIDSYRRLRQAIRPDRRDRGRPVLIGILERAIKQQPDFVEGRVIAALLHVYEGNTSAAEDHLRRAGDAIAKHGLDRSPFADDRCYAYLLLGRADKAADRVADLRDLQPKQRTALRCWLVGLNGMVTCRDGEARDHMRTALVEIGFFKEKKDLPYESAPLLGDAALLWLTANLEAVRDPSMARRILERTDPSWDVWQLARARAALAAEEGNWPEAIQQLDRCSEGCPPSLAEEVAAQRKAYGARERWIRPRPEAKGHANR